jgi:hypothetical protein
VDDGRACGERATTQLASWHKDPFQKSRKNYGGELTVSQMTPKSYSPVAGLFSVVAHRTLLPLCAARATRAAAPGREAGLGSHTVAARPLQRASAGFLEVLLFKKGRC